MENLQNTITKTETLKNNIKTIFNQIKQSIIRGGVSDFKELAQTPKQIEDLLKQYNKIAILKYENDLLMDRNGSLNLNLTFNPSILIITVAQNKKSLGDNRTSIKDIIIPNILQNNEFAIWWQSNYTYEGIAYFSKESLNWSQISTTMNTKVGYIRQIIAIE